MASERRQSDRDATNRWKSRAYTALTVKIHNGDANDFRDWCAARGTSVNAYLRACISSALGRPLENRARYRGDIEQSRHALDAAQAALESTR